MGINVEKDAGIAIGISTLIGIAINFCYVAMFKLGCTGKTLQVFYKKLLVVL